MSKFWDIYYRGTIGKWVDLCKKGNSKKIESGLFKDYLNLKFEIEEKLKEINSLEAEVIQKYPLLRSVPVPNLEEESKIFLEELIVYINSKKT